MDIQDIADNPQDQFEILNLEINHLSSMLEELASENFEKFVYLLYRLDINEQEVKHILKKSENQFLKISELVFERIKEKQKNRNLYTFKDDKTSQDRW